MDYQIFEIILLFVFYSIAGWIIEVFAFALSGDGFQNRGVCRGPYLTAYGLGALGVLYGLEYGGPYFHLAQLPLPIGAFCAGVVVSLILGLLSKVIIDGLCGGRLVRFKWYHPLLCGLLAVILVVHLNPLLTMYIRWMSPWVHMVFLIVFALYYPSQLIDGISRLIRFRKKMHFSQKHE